MNQNAFIEKIADKIADLGLTGPVMLLLEINRPLAFLGSQLMLIAQPTLNIFVSPSLPRQIIDLLADSAQVEQLINSLENTTTRSKRTVNNEEARL